MRERGSSPSRRGLLKGAAAAVAAAALANLAAADQADAELLAMGRELEALEAQERAADELSDRLYEEAARTCPAPSAALLAYSWRGEPLFRASGEGYRLNSEPYGALLQRARGWQDMGVSGGHYPEAPLIADLKRWEDGRRAACDANGCAAVMAEMDRLARAGTALCSRIAATPAATLDGMRVKLQALAYCHRGEPGDKGEWITEVINNTPPYGRGFTTDERLVYSVFHDVCGLLVAGATA
ncbi:twin-arginine translocation signal domain-containing protein [Xanthobacter dioxanivorans]|uniref:Twin-arginine translocation signal domain-containing protein n=1 Tax=Xanthobacter dioxanivorans TaxID=2528964 RepID=A0A974SJM9_9HYPH|nr:twin-arginine translocation signal domain-containing protein [Xanthobacter dioxanivorans]QRG07930.1 twin-arginine translocation signal domain-containing protein [Xanthobacter dioxanivorans]